MNSSLFLFLLPVFLLFFVTFVAVKAESEQERYSIKNAKIIEKSPLIKGLEKENYANLTNHVECQNSKDCQKESLRRKRSPQLSKYNPFKKVSAFVGDAFISAASGLLWNIPKTKLPVLNGIIGRLKDGGSVFFRSNPLTNNAIVDSLKEIVNFLRNMNKNSYSQEVDYDRLCTPCRIIANGLVSQINKFTPLYKVEYDLIHMCALFNVVDDDICETLIKEYLPAAYYILTTKDHPKYTGDDICAVLIQNSAKCRKMTSSWMTNWNVKIDELKYRKDKNKKKGKDTEIIDGGGDVEDISKHARIVVPSLHNGKKTQSKILLMADLHIDLHYAKGSVGNCDKYTCCRKEDNNFIKGSRSAGSFGDYKCDTPISGLDDMLTDAAGRHKDYDFVIFVGDIVHHVIWTTSKKDNIEHYKIASEYFKGAFPNTPIFPVVGNHDSHPCNLYPPKSAWNLNGGLFDGKWVYESLAEHFSRDLPPDAIKTFKSGGYYSINPKPRLRVIAINTNFCYILNFWIFYDLSDPDGHLQWIADTLLEAEENDENVWILGHQSPGSTDCWYYWTEQFNKIIDRFDHIITSQFFGHTHNDDFKIYFDSKTIPPLPSNSLYIGASTTAYKNLNPGYKIFFADGDKGSKSWEIMNHETWIFDLEKANQIGYSDWYKLYDAKDAYGLTSFDPGDLYDLVLRMIKDDSLFQLYFKFFNKDSSEVSKCEGKCKIYHLCSLVTTNIADQSHCEKIKYLAKH